MSPAPLLSLPLPPLASTTSPSTKYTTTKTHTNPCLGLLLSCTTTSHLKQIHAHMLRTHLFSDPFSAGRLVATSALSLNSLTYARLVLSQIPAPTTFTCNSIIRAYTNQKSPREALLFYKEMVENGLVLPDKHTYPSLFKCCGDLCSGRQVHCHVVKLGFGLDSYVQNTMIKMYADCGCLRDAQKMFDGMVGRNVISWATMIGACTDWDQPAEALRLYRKMEEEGVEANEIVLLNVLVACSAARDLGMGRRVHRYVENNQVEFSVVLYAALLDMYCKCGKISLARKMFDEMSDKNLYCWNMMINGHVAESNYKEALMLFREMKLEGVKADKVTIASLLLACSHLGALDLGKWLHVYINRENVEVDVVLGTALVDMYAKCGCIESATNVFQQLPYRDAMTWTALIVGLAMSGLGEKALEVFDEMQKNGIEPDAVTFIGVLAACSHASLVDEGYSHFDSMSSIYNIQPTVEHYGCMVDLLGRAGQLYKAEELVRNMPMIPDYFVLGSLLGACKVHGNIEIAERTAQRILQADPGNAGAYILLSNIYGSLKKWDEVKRVRGLMAKRNIRKPPGCSVIEVDGVVHEFVMGDKSHPRSSEIYAMVEDMICQLKASGYVPNMAQVLFDMDEEEKENALCHHSEKLAVAFGLISTNPGTPLRVVKNLRICDDCHSAMKCITLIYGREIIVRDRNRFHHFKGGSCSCKGFW